jgi:general secretion pathway protein I
MPAAPFRYRSGFSLLEVLLALVIFAIAAVVLGAGYLNILNDYSVISRGTGENQDVAFAREELVSQGDLPTAENGDEYDLDEGRHLKWSVQISPTTTTDLFSVDFTCVITSTAPGVPPRTFTQNFMLLRPTWSDPADRASLRQAAAQRIAKLQGKTT